MQTILNFARIFDRFLSFMNKTRQTYTCFERFFMQQQKKFGESLVTLVNRNTLTITGVEKMITVTPSQITLVACQSPLNIFGSELTVQKLDVENGNVKIVGTVDAIKYNQAKEPILKRIFK